MAVRVRAESSAYAWRPMGGPVKRDYSLGGSRADRGNGDAVSSCGVMDRGGTRGLAMGVAIRLDNGRPLGLWQAEVARAETREWTLRRGVTQG